MKRGNLIKICWRQVDWNGTISYNGERDVWKMEPIILQYFFKRNFK